MATSDGVGKTSSSDPDSGTANDNGILFRHSAHNWVHNLSTKDLTTGAYEIIIETPNGQRYAATFVPR